MRQVSYYLNNTSWVQLHVFHASWLATGDLDGNGRADVILGFPGLGLWALKNLNAWTPLHSITPEAFVSGQISGS